MKPLKQVLPWTWRMFASLLSVVSVSPQVFAQATHYVDNIGSCDGLLPCHATIMDAVNAAAASEIIEVFVGVYHETVTFKSKSDIVLRAHHKRFAPVMTSETEATVQEITHHKGPRRLAPVIAGGFRFEGSSGIQVKNFILKSGGEVYGGGGIVLQGNFIKGGFWFSSCNPNTQLKDNVIVGGRFHCERGGALVEGNTFINGEISFGAISGNTRDATIRHNVLSGGGIRVGGEKVLGTTIESNRIDGGDIVVGNGAPQVQLNTIRRNVVRGGGIRLVGTVQSSSIEANFVSGSATGGILVDNRTGFGFSGGNVIKLNTSIENTGCDINDTGTVGAPNVWKENRFATRCGMATE